MHGAWHGMAFPHYDEEGSTSGSEIFPAYASAHKRSDLRGGRGREWLKGLSLPLLSKTKHDDGKRGEEEQEDHGSPPCLHRLRGAKVMG